MNILITGVAGFIGQALAQYLLTHTEHTIVGVDNLNDYYPVILKEKRLAQLNQQKNFTFKKIDLADTNSVQNINESFDLIIHLAAQAGVRYSIENPIVYAQSNLLGFTNILQLARTQPKAHLVYASSSSVYGQNNQIPFTETDLTDHPVSFYAATKKANEVMAVSYTHLYNLSITGLRFFTVYGPFGRPDMAPWLFTQAILEGKPIKVFNHGKMKRDFTYIDDIVEGIWRLATHPQRLCSNTHEIYNIGNNQPVQLMEFIQTIETACQKEAIKEFLPMQDGDVPITYANTDKLNALTGFQPSTPLKIGIEKFVSWYQSQ
ncbi:NAD-dependent epimerase/dehydratase family protein [Neisseria sp. Ec49-e6-T10]|uniref:NAD-dependent epimerase/dehydratase family protein n=1 Tax=Neisseria sp. Ec49-e6-T10 TaxID=3140744 RepID=UPI003EB9DC28